MSETVISPYWFIRIDRLWRWPRALFGTLIFLLIFGPLIAALDFDNPNGETRWSILGQSLFFAFINAYALTMTASVIARAQRALDQLRPELDLSAEEFEHIRQSLSGAPRRVLAGVALAGLAAGLIHNALLSYALDAGGSGTASLIASSASTILTWFVMLHCIFALIRNAELFDELGRSRIRVDLLRPAQVEPFGVAAWLPATALMGTQIAYPLLSLGGLNLLASLPGFGLTLISVIYLLIRPMWNVHKHLREARTALLRSIDTRLTQWRSRTPDLNLADDALQEVTSLLQFRAQVDSLPVWPFNPALAARWLFYVIIPPVTWVLAALTENLVND